MFISYILITIASAVYSVLEYTGNLTTLSLAIFTVIYGVILYWFVRSFTRSEEKWRSDLDGFFSAGNLAVFSVFLSMFHHFALLNSVLAFFFISDYIYLRLSWNTKKRNTKEL